MSWKLLGLLLFAVAATLGFCFRDNQYRLDSKRMAADQEVLDHRDSAYTSMTWVASPSENYLQLRFFDKVEGGVCLHPTWQELVDLKDPRLAHLVPATRPEMAPPAKIWPFTWTPDPGTVSNSPYVRLFPLSILMNNKLVAAAGTDPRQANARILVVGLGSGAGIAVLAHHFPNAAITVVDIDRKVVEMVRDHFPLIRWLSEQKRADGEPRLQFKIGDARQFIHFHGERKEPSYDVLILDAYTAGSTIPSHLMTREFFLDCARVLDDDGILLANVIGSYGTSGPDNTIEGEKHRVLGGAIRSFRAAGLVSVINFPVLSVWETAGDFNLADPRNNIVVASRKPLEPKGAGDERWERLKSFVLFPEVAAGKNVSRQYLLRHTKDDNDWATSLVDASVIEGPDPTFASKLTPSPTALKSITFRNSSDKDAIKAARRAVVAWAQKERGGKMPCNWDERETDQDAIALREIDWVLYARETYLTSVVAAREVTKHGGEALVGDKDFLDETKAPDNAILHDAPIFTDQRPNADILNR